LGRYADIGANADRLRPYQIEQELTARLEQAAKKEVFFSNVPSVTNGPSSTNSACFAIAHSPAPTQWTVQPTLPIRATETQRSRSAQRQAHLL
jgi:hypothetical protein